MYVASGRVGSRRAVARVQRQVVRNCLKRRRREIVESVKLSEARLKYSRSGGICVYKEGGNDVADIDNKIDARDRL